MSAEEKSIDIDLSGIKKLGIIAGGGGVPRMVLESCDVHDIEPFVVAIEGQAERNLVKGREHMWAQLSKVGAIIKTLRAHEVSDLVLIGRIKRPSFAEMKPDLKTAEFIAKVGLSALGDNGLLSAVRKFLENEGFRLHGAHKFTQDLLAPSGVIGKCKPSKADMVDIVRGFKVSQELGRMDVGQAVIVQEGIVVGVEAIEGTDELIKRCTALYRPGRKGVLVKTCKPQQDRDLDLPTIGPDTVEHAARCGLGGIAIHADHALVYDREALAEIADKHKLYVIGVDASDFNQ